jgi:hypothetical protein
MIVLQLQSGLALICPSCLCDLGCRRCKDCRSLKDHWYWPERQQIWRR